MQASRSLHRRFPLAALATTALFVSQVAHAGPGPVPSSGVVVEAVPPETAGRDASEGVAPASEGVAPASAGAGAGPDETGWGASAFGAGGDELEGDEHEFGEEDALDQELDEEVSPLWQASPEQWVTVPGAARTLAPVVRVGPSGNARHKWTYRALLAFRYNPLGATADIVTGHRVQLIDRDSALFRDSHLLTGMRVLVTPAYVRIGPRIEFQPLALLRLHAGYSFAGHFGTFDLVQSFPSATSDYSDSTLDRRGEAGDNYATRGQIADFGARLQAKAGPIALRSQFTMYWLGMNLRGGDRVWYDQFLDIALPGRGWALNNDADVLYVFPNSGLKLAVRYSLTHALYTRDQFLPGEPVSQPNGPHHRVGPGIIYSFYDRPSERFNLPTVVLLTQWFIQHRYRTGQDVSQAVPQVVLALTFKGDLLPHPQRRRVPRAAPRRAVPPSGGTHP